MTTRFKRTVVALACVSGFALAQEVTTNFDPTVNFSKFTTYKWVNVEGGPGSDGSEDMADGHDMIDEDAIEQFGRELDDGFNEADLAARALEEDQGAGAAAPASMPS